MKRKTREDGMEKLENEVARKSIQRWVFKRLNSHIKKREG